MKFKVLKYAAAVLLVLLTAAAAADIGHAVLQVNEEKKQEDRIRLEEALVNAAVACYAIEGAYPDSAEYLIVRCGIQYNSDRFEIKYEYLGSNLLPDITVLCH